MTALLALLIQENAIVRIDVESGAVEHLIRDAGDAPDGITVVGDTVYWTTMGMPTATAEAEPDFSARNGGVRSVRMDGSEARYVVSQGDITTGKQLIADGDRLYWSDREGRRVSSCRFDGTDRVDLVINQEPGIENECVGVAVDSAGGWLYWTQKGPAKGGRGRILRAPLDGTPGQRSDVETLWDGLPEPIDLELADGYLYWTDRGAEPSGNTLNRAPIPAPGTAGGTPEILARGFHEAIGLAVDTDGGLVYVSDLGGQIRAVPLPGHDGAERTIATLGTPVTGIALV
ncbi:hypothetical protein [Tsukamurella strandjordii]|uniref:3-hydroxyacyl-CoA dehydrogenase n=1 Tax=Tsukamurella strandjordii TaxID=147577 RepID=A0AA90NH48_9ACTN|nr:hypothetical protein [Tsukamurella strandjordii]MDP0400287.1 hypothetical protein [Tsukamurella strandjordii]